MTPGAPPGGGAGSPGGGATPSSAGGAGLPALTVDPRLVVCWPGPRPLGLAWARAGERAAVVAVTAEPVPGSALDAARVRLAAALGATSPDLVAASGATLLQVVRDWLFQAAQGSGRGVQVRLEDGGAGELRLLLDSWDSSAREAVLRLSSPQDPALAALEALVARPVVLGDVS